MAEKSETQKSGAGSHKRRPSLPVARNYRSSGNQLDPVALIQRYQLDPSSLTPQNILQLQRQIGNRAVDRFLTASATGSANQGMTSLQRELFDRSTAGQIGVANGVPGRGDQRPSRSPSGSTMTADISPQDQATAPAYGTDMLQRWSADEHMALGDTTGIKIDIGGGVELTFGQVVALAGDEFGSLEELREATTTEDGRAMIRAHLERANIPGTAAASLPEPSEPQRSQASSEYITLAMDNSEHFVGGGTAVENWLSKHAQAISEALQAGLQRDESMLNQANMTEAFGDHFLTDAFSSGHIRVPRDAITSYYTNSFAPQVVNHLVSHLKSRLVDELYDQIEQQTAANEAAWLLGPIAGLGVRAYMRGKIEDAIDEKIDEGFAAAGGRQQVIRYLGLGLAGIISGAMHDAENENGLMVVSDIHPTPWMAYGDDELDTNPEHRARLEAAVQIGIDDLQRAYGIGLEEGQSRFNVLEPDSVPGIVYFGFDSDELTPEAAASVDMVSHFLHYHPATVVTLTGHADQIGGDPYNDDLASTRVHMVSDRLLSLGIDTSRMEVTSMGEKAPATTNRSQYHLNRRVTFSYATSIEIEDSSPDDVALENARQQVLDQVGPPYAAEGHLPRAAAGLNAELPEWRWGSLPNNFQTEMANWIKHYINQYAGDALAGGSMDPMTVDDFEVRPRPIAQALVAEILADPISFLEGALGRSAD